MTLTLPCDHRVFAGAVGAQYLHALKTLLESPALLLVCSILARAHRRAGL